MSYVFGVVDTGHRTDIALRPSRTVMLRLLVQDDSRHKGMDLVLN